jgi:ABC-2 type transport system permease protein
MAVYKRNYKPYLGRLTPDWSHFLVPARYSLETLFQSRLVVGFLVFCYIIPIICGTIIYLHHNLSALALLKLDPRNLLPIDKDFFMVFLSQQGMLAFLFAAYAGPGLVSPDLSNNALPLYLCRPISRAEYVLGKMAVLFIPLSCLTWIPGLMLWGLQAGLEGNGWGMANLKIAWTLFAGSVLWILILSLLSLALSAWIRWKMMASALLFGIFFISAAFSEIFNEILRTKSGYLFNLGHLIGKVWLDMMGLPPRGTIFGELFNVRRGDEIPLWTAWVMLGFVCSVCILVLDRKLRAREVVS